MADCLLDFIGIKDCTIATVPESGIYINDLPGIEIQNIDQIANAEQSTFVGVWTEIQKRALRRFKTDVIAEFGKRYKLRQVQQTVDLGKVIDTTSTTVAAVEWRGFTLELNDEDERWVNSNMQTISIQQLYLYLPGAVNTTIKVFDLDLGDELYTYALTGALGWNTIKVGQMFTASRIYVCYDATAINSVELDITDMPLDSNSYCSNGYWFTHWNCSDSYTKLKGAKTTKTATVTSVTEGDNTFGLSGVFSVKCTFDNVICNNKEHFAEALLHCLGSELMTERINSSRINRWTTVDKPKAQELRKYFEARYKGGTYDEITYEGELAIAVCGIDLNTNDKCLQCDNLFRFVEAKL
jgi:hypothetical protein